MVSVFISTLPLVHNFSEPETDEQILNERIREEKDKIAAQAKVLKEKSSQLESLKRNFTDLQTRNIMRHEKHERDVKKIEISTDKVKYNIENLKRKIEELSEALKNSMYLFLFTRKLITFKLNI